MRRAGTTNKRRPAEQRQGIATVEFALVLPLFVTVTLGTVEFGNAFQRTNVLAWTLREGGQLASMEFNDVLLKGQTANEKVILDIRNIMTANGLPGDEATIEITHADGPHEGSTFILSDKSNGLRFFRISATLDYADVSIFPTGYMQGNVLEKSIVMRMGKSVLAQ